MESREDVKDGKMWQVSAWNERIPGRIKVPSWVEETVEPSARATVWGCLEMETSVTNLRSLVVM